MNLSLAFTEMKFRKMKDKTIKRSFVIGDEWIYFKFYTGPKTADKILLEAIKPFTEYLLNSGKIDQWFFIRYADPDLHLRIRLHYIKKNSVGIIIRTIFKYIEKFVEQELIWKVQTDTYQRELERYGIQTMELSEQFFFIDSTFFLKILPLLKNPEGEVHRWIYALMLIDNLLDSFQFKVEDKFHLLHGLTDSFGREFGRNYFLKGQLDAKFRKERNLIEQLLNPSIEKESNISNLIVYINEYKKIIAPLTHELLMYNNNTQLNEIYKNLITSYIHMSMNRIFKSKLRMHEMVLYDLLFRYYKSFIARQQKKIDVSMEEVLL
jgi:thiopeptide-type bacteriocin biosynthesis protein